MSVNEKGTYYPRPALESLVAVLLVLAMLLPPSGPAMAGSPPASFTLTVGSNENRAEVYLDGVIDGRTSGVRPPYTHPISGLGNGTYKIKLVKKGFIDNAQAVRIDGKDAAVTINLAPATSPAGKSLRQSAINKKSAQPPLSQPPNKDTFRTPQQQLRDRQDARPTRDAGGAQFQPVPPSSIEAPLLQPPARKYRVGRNLGSAQDPANLPAGFTPAKKPPVRTPSNRTAASRPDEAHNVILPASLTRVLVYVETPAVKSFTQKLDPVMASRAWQDEVRDRQRQVGRKLAQLKTQGKINDFKLVPNGNYFEVVAPKKSTSFLTGLPRVAGSAPATNENIAARQSQYSSNLQRLSQSMKAPARPAAASGQAKPQAAVSMTRIDAELNNNFVSGNTAPNAILTISLMGASGVVKATTVATATSAGIFSAWLFNSEGYEEPILGDDTVRVTPNGGSAVSVYVKSMTASFNRTTKTLSGTGPSTETLFAVLHHRQAGDKFLDYTANTNVSDFGGYTANFGSVGAITSDDWGTVTYLYSDGNTVYTTFRPSFVTAQLNTGNFWGYTYTPGIYAPVVATLRAGGAVKATVTTYSDQKGYFDSDFSDINGNAVTIAAGDTLEITSMGVIVISLTVAPITAAANIQTETVSGQAPAGSAIKVKHYFDFDEVPSWLWPGSDAQGNYSANFSPGNVRRGDYGEAYYENSQGNRVVTDYSVPVLDIHAYTSYVHGYTTAGASLTLTLKDASQALKATATAKSLSDGYYWADFVDPSFNEVIIQPGYVVQMTPQSGETLTTTAVELTAQANAATDIIQGKGPASSSLTVVVTSYALVGVTYGRGNYYSLIAATDAQGNYTANFSAVSNIRRGDLIELFYWDANGNLIYTSNVVPYLVLMTASSYAYGATSPNTSVTVTLKDAAQAVKATAALTSDSEGYFGAAFYDQAYNPILILPGYMVQVAPAVGEVLSVTAVALTAQANWVADTVQGQAPANSTVEAWLYSFTTYTQSSIVAATDALGNYSANFSGKSDMRRGDLVWVFYYAADGNMVYLAVASPILSVGFNTMRASGYVAPNVPLTATLRDASQVLKATSNLTADMDGYFYINFRDANGKPALILPGYTVQVAPQTGEALTVIVADLAAQVNVTTDVVQGKGPPNSRLNISASRYDTGVTTDAQGNYIANLAGKGDVRRADRISVYYYYPDGNRLYYTFTAPYLSVNVNSDFVSGYTTPNTALALTLNDPALGLFAASAALPKGSPAPRNGTSSVRASANLTSDTNGYFSTRLTDSSGNQALVQAGSIVQVTPQAGETLTVAAPELTGQANILTDTVQGKGPAGSILKVQATFESTYVTADAQGNYAASFAGKTDIKRRDSIQVRFDNADGHRIYLSFIVPYLRVRVNSDITSSDFQVSGSTTPNIPLKLILKDAAGVVKGTAAAAAQADGFFSVYFTDPDDNSVQALPGYVVEMVPETGEAASVTVVDITAQVNVTTDVVQGKGPANSTLTLTMPDTGYSMTTVTDAQGNYTANFAPAIDLKRADWIEVRYTDPQQNGVFLGLGAPYLEIEINSGYVFAYTTPNTAATLTLKDATQVVKATATATSGPGGVIETIFTDLNGNEVIILPGYTVQLTPQTGETLTLTALEMTAQVNVATDMVQGKAPAGALVEILVDNVFTETESVLTATADAQGNFTASFAGDMDLKRLDIVYVYYVNPNGHGEALTIGVPGLFVMTNGSIVSGQTTPNTAMTLTVKDASQTVKATASLRSASDGYFATDLTDRDNNPVLVLSGYTVQMVPQSGDTLLVTVPELTALANIATDVVQGKAPVGAAVELWTASHVVTATADAQGNYTASFAGTEDIKRGSEFRLRHERPDGNLVWMRYTVPYLAVRVNTALVAGYITPNSTFTATLKDTAQVLKGTATGRADNEGKFVANFVRGGYIDVPVLPGYTISLVPQTGDTLSLTAVELTGQVNMPAGTVQGKGPAGSSVEARVSDRLQEPSVYVLTSPTDAQGNFTARSAGKVVIKRRYGIELRHYAPDGSRTLAYFNVPLLVVKLNSSDVWGYATPRTSYTATLRDASLAVKGTDDFGCDDDGQFYLAIVTNPYQSVPILPGYTLQLVPKAGQTGESFTFVAPELSAQANIAADTVQGKGPATSGLIIYTLDDQGLNNHVAPTTDAQGNYTGSFAGREDVKRRTRLELRYYNADGHQAYTSSTVPYASVTLNSNYVSGHVNGQTAVALTLKDASQAVRASATANSNPDGYFSRSLRDAGGNPVPVLPGYTLQIAPQGGESFTMTAVEITSQTNISTDVVQGYGPPNSRVKVTVSGQDREYSLLAATDAQGSYSASFASRADIRRLDWIDVAYYDAEGNGVYQSTKIPGVYVSVSDSYANGAVTPRTTTAITVKDASQAVKWTRNVTSDDDGRFNAQFYDQNHNQIPLLPGYAILVVPQVGESFTVPVPDVTTQPNATTDVVQGKGPANSSLTLYMRGYQLTADTDPQGNYTANFAGRADIERGQSFYVEYWDPNGNRMRWWYMVPYLIVQINDTHIEGATTPNVPVTITLKDASQTVRASIAMTSGADGYFGGSFQDLSANRVNVGFGNTVQVVPQTGETLTVAIPQFTVQANIATDTVQGLGPPNAQYRFEVDDYLRWAFASVDVTADAQGNYTADFAGLVDIDRLTLIDVYFSTPDGNTVVLQTVVPGLQLWLNTWAVQGAAGPNTPVTLTLKDASQTVKATASLTTDTDGSFGHLFDDQGGNSIPLLPGYVVQMTPQTGQAFSLTVVDLTAQANLTTDVIYGKAPPNSSVRVTLLMRSSLTVTADSQGNYTANFAGKADVRRGSTMIVDYRNADENSVMLYLEITSNPSPAADIAMAGPASQAEMSADGYSSVKVKISSIKDSATGDPLTVADGIGAYEATLTYPPTGIAVVSVAGVAPFGTPAVTINNPGGITTISANQTTSTSQHPPLTLADVRLRLLGTKDQNSTVTVNFTAIAGVQGDYVSQRAPVSQVFRRGDANASGGQTAVNITDALYIAQYLAGLKDVSAINTVNAASVNYDGAGGDKITITDALFIAQMLAGLRDASFNWP